MNKGIIGKIAIVIVAISVFLCASKLVYAAPVDLNTIPGIEDISSNNTTNNITTNTTNSATAANATNTNSTTNTVNKTKNTTNSSNPSKIPQTGSNEVIIFCAGVFVIGIVAAVFFSKFNNIKLQ